MKTLFILIVAILSLSLSACEHAKKAAAFQDDKAYCAQHPAECSMSTEPLPQVQS